MSEILYGHSDEVAHWVATRIPHIRPRVPYFAFGKVFGESQSLGVLSGGELVAGVVFHNHDPFVGNIEVSCAAATPRWGNREIFRSVLRYPFAQLGCIRVTALTPRHHPKGATSPRRFLEGLGFQREGSLRRALGDDNLIVYGLLRDEWEGGRFCRPRRDALTDGQEHPSPAAAA